MATDTILSRFSLEERAEAEMMAQDDTRVTHACCGAIAGPKRTRCLAAAPRNASTRADTHDWHVTRTARQAEASKRRHRDRRLLAAADRTARRDAIKTALMAEDED